MHRLVRHDADHPAVEAREAADDLLRVKGLDLEEAGRVDHPIDQLLHVERSPLVFGDERVQCYRGPGIDRGDRARHFRPVLWEIGKVAPSSGDGIFVGGHQQVREAAHGRVHASPAHLLERDLLADHHLRHARGAEVHAGIALDHDRDVAEGGDVGAARCRGAEEQADLRHHPRESNFLVEDATRVAASREHLHLVGDARAGRVDQVEDRHAQPLGRLLDAHDFLHGARPPRSRLDGRVVGHHAHRAPLDAADDGHDAVGAVAGFFVVGEEPVLDQEVRVEQQLEPPTHRQLVLLPQLFRVLRGAARPRGLGASLEIVARVLFRGRIRSAHAETVPISGGARL